MTETPRPSPACAAVLDALTGQGGPVSIEELSARLGRHPNTVREHLSWLVDHGYVEREARRGSGRGRPAWLYHLATDRPRQHDYSDLASALAWRIATASLDPIADALAAGRYWAQRYLVGHTPASSHREAREATVLATRHMGYEPEPDMEFKNVVLHRCPLLQAAHEESSVVCSVHRGLVHALMEFHGAPTDDIVLTPFAEPGRCHLRLAT